MSNELDYFYRPWLEAGRPGFEQVPTRPDIPAPEEELLASLQEGEAMRRACISVSHDEPQSAMPDKRESKQWLFTAQQLVNIAKMPLESRRRVAAAIAAGAPQELFEAFEAGNKAIRAQGG
ncbi:MAG: hypothetical protein ACPHCI_08655 [Solirubrobacterales bacterium]